MNLQAVNRVAVLITCGLVSVWAGSQIFAQRTGQRPAPRREAVEPVKPGTMTFPLTASAAAGSDAAGIAVVEFADFECPSCGDHARRTYPILEREFIQTGKAKYVFRHLPLPRHAGAVGAATAVECARPAGKFWELHDVLFRNQQALQRERLGAYAESVKLNRTAFEECLDAPVPQIVTKDLEHAKTLGIAATPTFLLGRVENGIFTAVTRINGAVPATMFSSALEALLKKR